MSSSLHAMLQQKMPPFIYFFRFFRKQHKDPSNYTSVPRKVVCLLPDDLIVSILVRLPVKSLWRCKCVCKSWYTIISDSHFARAHMNCQTPKFVILPAEYNATPYLMDLEPPYHAKTKLTIPLRDAYVIGPNRDYMDFYFDSLFELTCDGLILTSDILGFFYLWNPTTKFYRVIQHPTPLDGHAVCGFGYDGLSDDYKLVFAMNSHNVHVFTLKTNFWRRIQNLPFDLSSSWDHCILRGNLHWRVHFGVIYFNLAKEKFGEFKLPNYMKDKVCSLGILGNNICITYQSCGLSFVVCIMEKYGVKESWTEVLAVPYINFDYVKPIRFTKEGDVIMLVKKKWESQQLILYDPNEVAIKKVIKKSSHRMDVFAFVESAVLFPGAMPILYDGVLAKMTRLIVWIMKDPFKNFAKILLVIALVFLTGSMVHMAEVYDYDYDLYAT